MLSEAMFRRDSRPARGTGNRTGRVIAAGVGVCRWARYRRPSSRSDATWSLLLLSLSLPLCVCADHLEKRELVIRGFVWPFEEPRLLQGELRPLSEQSPNINLLRNIHHSLRIESHFMGREHGSIYMPDRRAPSSHATPATTPSTMRTFDP